MKFRRLLALLGLGLCIAPLGAQQGGHRSFQNTMPGKHAGPVTALFHDGNEIYSAGRDGFLEIWNIPEGAARERFQLSPFAINAMVRHPAKNEICLVESDGLGLYRVSAWNYRNREKLFSLRLSDPVGFVNYSAGGNFIIVGCTGRSGFVFIDSQSGQTLKSPDVLSASIAFAATGKSERSMISYFASGTLSYWDLARGARTTEFQVPRNLESPVMFGNNRFFAGVDSSGLALIDATSGALLDRYASIPANSLLAVSADELHCLVRQGSGAGVYHFSVERRGRLVEKKFIPLPVRVADISAFSLGGGIVLGMSDGTVMALDANGLGRLLSFSQQKLIAAAAVSGSHIAVLTPDYSLGFLPLDYAAPNFKYFPAPDTYEPYTKISPLMSEGGAHDQFLLWQADEARTLPLIVAAESAAESAPPVPVAGISLRFPLRSAQSFGQKILLLDTAGNLSALPFGGATGRPFSFSSVGIMDAAFINKDNVILCRSAVSRNTPFLLLNVATGETVPLAWPCAAAVAAYRSGSGNIYAITVEESGLTDQAGDDGIKTAVIKINTANPANSEKIIEIPGEDIQFSLAEAGGRLAATIGGEGASLYGTGGRVPFERTSGLPLQLYGAGRLFISLDADGNIAWHDAQTGRILAVFRLYDGEWSLQTRARTIRNNY